MYPVDSVVIQFLAFMKSKELLPTSTKILLVGEDSKVLHEDSLAARIKKMGYRVSKILKEGEQFPENIKQYDLVISVRGCRDEEDIITTCSVYDKKYITVPCTSSAENIHQKVIGYIHQFKIPGIYVGPEKGKRRDVEFTYPNFHYILYNI